MGYCSLEDIKSVIPQQELINLTVDSPTRDSAIDETIFNQCAEFSDSLIDGYIRAKYTLPLMATIPVFLKELAKDITAYRLYLRRPQKLPEHIKDNYNKALDLLTRIKRGDILLEAPSELPDGQIQKPKPTFLVRVSDRIFTDKVMHRYGI